MTRFGEGLLVGAGAAAFVGTDGVGLDTLVGDEDGVGDLIRGGAGEGAVELGDIDAAAAELALDGGVHGGEELVAKLVEDFINVDVGQGSCLRGGVGQVGSRAEPLCTRVQGGGHWVARMGSEM